MKKMVASFLFAMSVCSASDLKLLISPEEISAKVDEVAMQIDQEYQGQDLTVVMVMKGAFCLTADLIRQMKTPTTIEYIKANSYGANGASRGELTVHGLDNLNLDSKNVLIIDDIFDSGTTMETIRKQVEAKNPASVKTLVLLMKNTPRAIKSRPDYVLFDIEDLFVVGYGLDFKEKHRGLPGIYYFD